MDILLLSTELIPRDDDIMSMFDYDGSRMPIAIVSRTPMGGFENADKLESEQGGDWSIATLVILSVQTFVIFVTSNN